MAGIQLVMAPSHERLSEDGAFATQRRLRESAMALALRIHWG
jgi:hypothetical protein